MKFSEADPGDGYYIEGYEPGRIFIEGKVFVSGLILTPRGIITGWGPERPAELNSGHIDALLACDAQVILIGTGARQIFPDFAVMAQALARGIGIEIMDTGAACRTYNILVAEGRQVAAGLLPI